MIFASMMVPFVNGWTSLVESSAIGAIAALVASLLEAAHDAGYFSYLHQADIGHLMYVHVDYSCRAWIWGGV